MFCRTLKNKFSEKIDTKDLIQFLKYGFIYLLISSIIMSLVDMILTQVFNLSGMSLVVGIFFMFPLMANQIKKNIYSTHIIYGIIFTIFCLLSLFLYNLVDLTLLYYQSGLIEYFNIKIIFDLFMETYNVLGFLQRIINFNQYTIFEVIKVVFLFISYKNSLRIINY